MHPVRRVRREKSFASGLRDRLRGDLLRYGACAICVVLGVLAALRID